MDQNLKRKIQTKCVLRKDTEVAPREVRAQSTTKPDIKNTIQRTTVRGVPRNAGEVKAQNAKKDVRRRSTHVGRKSPGAVTVIALTIPPETARGKTHRARTALIATTSAVDPKGGVKDRLRRSNATRNTAARSTESHLRKAVQAQAAAVQR